MKDHKDAWASCWVYAFAFVAFDAFLDWVFNNQPDYMHRKIIFWAVFTYVFINRLWDKIDEIKK